MIAGVVLFITALVVIISLILPNTYTATSRLVFESAASPFGETDSASTERQLATTEALLTSQQVLDRAAARVPGVSSGDDLEDKVSSSVEPEANIVNVSASDGDPDEAAKIANAVTAAFLSERATLERRRIARARQQLGLR